MDAWTVGVGEEGERRNLVGLTNCGRRAGGAGRAGGLMWMFDCWKMIPTTSLGIGFVALILPLATIEFLIESERRLPYESSPQFS